MRLFGLLVLSFLFHLSLSALDASVLVSSFKSGKEAFLEVNLHIIGATLQYDSSAVYPLDQQGVEVLITITQGEEIIKYSKYLLRSPEKNISNIDLIDAKRYILEDGAYRVDVHLIDKYNPEFEFKFSSQETLSFDQTTPILSSLQLLAKAEPTDQNNSLVKNGLLMEVIPYNFVSQKYDILTSYIEAYSMDMHISKGFYIAYGIYEGYAGEEGKVWKQKYKKIAKSPVKAELLLFDLTQLPSGNYHYKVQLFTREKELLSTSLENFQRSNPEADILELDVSVDVNDQYENSFVHKIETSQLDYVLQAISPAVPPKFTAMSDQLIKSNKVKSKRYLIHKYFVESYGENAEESYSKYMEIAKKVDIEFNDGFGPGFLSDRGYIYLKYGQPSDVIAVEDEPSAPPYQVWIYEYLPSTNQTNVKFLFYNPSLSPNAYDLLHSTCRFEVSNPRWELDLYSDDLSARQNQDLNSTNMPDGLNRRAREFFDGNN